MSDIKAEIQQYMTGFTEADRKLTSRFLFPHSFIGFQGHFPANKILPGVCQIQCLLSTIEKWAGRAVELKEVIMVKYAAPVFPDEEIVCCVNELPDTAGEFIVRGRIEKGAAKATELKLRLVLAEET